MDIIRKADLARHWGVSPAYVTIVLKRHPGPDGAEVTFTTLEQADTWRAIHAPPKPAKEQNRQSAKQNGVEAAKKIASDEHATPAVSSKAAGVGGNGEDGGEGLPANKHEGGGSGGNRGGGAPSFEAYIERDGDFDAIMIRQAEEVPQIAYGLYREACASKDSVAVANASRNWSEAAKQAALVRERFLEVQEKSRALIPLDLVMDVVGNELQPIRSLLVGMDDRYGAKANPDNPALGKAVIAAAIDEVFRQIEIAQARVRGGCGAEVAA